MFMVELGEHQLLQALRLPSFLASKSTMIDRGPFHSGPKSRVQRLDFGMKTDKGETLDAATTPFYRS